MNPTAFALTGYILIFLLVLTMLPVVRGMQMLKGKKAVNQFKPDGTDCGPFALRLTRVHANFYESFPFIGGLLLTALATGQTAITDPLAPALLGARCCQAVIHLISTSQLAVWLRFLSFLVQVLIALWWAVQLIQVFMG